MSSHERKVIHAFPFAANDSRASGQVEIIHRTSTFDEDRTREFIDLNIRIGDRFLGIPIQHIDEMIARLQEAKPLAEEERRKVMEKIRSDPRDSNRSRPGDRRRHDGGRRDDRRRGWNEED